MKRTNGRTPAERSGRSALLVALVCGWPAAAGPTEAPCVGQGPGSHPATALAQQAVKVLEFVGHDANDYRLELRQDDVFAVAGSGRRPSASVVFRPLDPVRDPVLTVSRDDPCVVAWVWAPREFTAWQRSVLQQAFENLGEQRPSVAGLSVREIRITESRDLIGVRFAFEPGDGEAQALNEARIVLFKEALATVERRAPALVVP